MSRKPQKSNEIFDVLLNVDLKNRQYFKTLPEESLKKIPPLVLLKWMGSTNSASQLMVLNEFVNPYVFSLGNRKHLLLDLLMASGMGKRNRYEWTATLKNTSKKDNLKVEIVKGYYKYSSKEARDVIDMFGIEDYIEMAGYIGMETPKPEDLE